MHMHYEPGCQGGLRPIPVPEWHLGVPLAHDLDYIIDLLRQNLEDGIHVWDVEKDFKVGRLA
jgi:hypothetical protein